MKASVLTLGLLMICTTALARAEGPEHSGDRSEHRARMQQELGLSEEQIEQMRAIHEQGGSREEMRAVMTPEQQTQAEELRATHKGKREEKMSRMQKHLDLTEDQMAQMREIREQGGSREEMHAILTDEQQAKIGKKRGHYGKDDEG